MRSFFYTILLLLLSACAYAQPAATTDDKLFGIQQITNDTLRMDSLYHYAGDKVYDHPKEAIAIGKILMKDAGNHNNRLETANAYMIVGQGYEFVSDYPKSLKCYLDALDIYKELKLYYSQINVLLGISRVYDLTDDLGNQKKYVEEAMAICDQEKDNKRISKKRVRVLDYLATIYKKEGRYDTSIKLYNQAIGLARKANDTNQQMSSLCNLAIALKSNKNYDASLAAYNEALALTDTSKDIYPFVIITDNMAILFYQMGDLVRSERYALEVLATVQARNNPDILKDVYETLKNVYQKEKRYPEALDYYDKWSAVKDSILDREKSQQITLWQTKFDSESKDKEIQNQEKQIADNRKINLYLILSSVLFLLLGLIIFRSYNAQKRSNALLTKEKKRSEDLLLNILPAEVADELKDRGVAAAKHFDDVTVLFTDFVNFTQASERMSPQQLIDELHYFFKAFDQIIDKYHIEKIKTIGDSYLAVSGLPVADPKHAENIIRAAIEINEFVTNRKQQLSDVIFEVRIGVHSGSVIAGIVGVKKFSYDIWGDTVNTAARMEQNSEPGKINISQTTYELVKDQFPCIYRGEIEAKNKGLLKMYFVSYTTGHLTV